MDKPREIALKTLVNIEQEKSYSNIILNKMIKENNNILSEKDKGFISELVYGIVSMKLTLDEIIKKVQSKDGEMTVSTIYRILNSFCTANLLSNIFNPDAGKSYYDITVAEHHHVFKGEQVMDYMDDELTAMIRKYLKDKNFASEDIEKVQVQIIINEPKSNP